ncbi:hypothetical protein ACFYZ8_33330 [Streptomyces sp. NPDC001668]|uniref:hypothetical protein n=1 Tax=Streptomyces sp. NPDC001668 TaxID=3364598 RepID=UPI0036ABD1A3
MAESPLQVYIYAADAADRDAALQVLSEAGLEFGFDRTDAPATLALGELYGTYEEWDGQWAEVARRLIEKAPSAVFELWQDPSEERDGSYVAHVPAVGTVETGCDLKGVPHVNLPDLLARLSALPDHTTVAEWLAGGGAAFLGSAVLEALKPYQAAAGR